MCQSEYLWSNGLNSLIVTFSQILVCSKLKEFADVNLKSNENGRKFSKWIKNTVGKGENARYDNFSFSHSVFKRLQTRKNQGLFGKGLIFAVAGKKYSEQFYLKILTFEDPEEESFSKHCGKRRKCLWEEEKMFVTCILNCIHCLQMLSIRTDLNCCHLTKGL